VSTFVRGARIAESSARRCRHNDARAGGDADHERFAINVSALAESGLLFRDPSRRRPGAADFMGKAVVGGRPWKIRGYWSTTALERDTSGCVSMPCGHRRRRSRQACPDAHVVIARLKAGKRAQLGRALLPQAASAELVPPELRSCSSSSRA
jgi:hypothetical protein